MSYILHIGVLCCCVQVEFRWSVGTS